MLASTQLGGFVVVVVGEVVGGAVELMGVVVFGLSVVVISCDEFPLVVGVGSSVGVVEAGVVVAVVVCRGSSLVLVVVVFSSGMLVVVTGRVVVGWVVGAVVVVVE